jgi:hypothetical protein
MGEWSICTTFAPGNVKCWGAGFFGGLGYGNTTAIGDNETPSAVGFVPVGGLVSQVSAGFNHTCVVLSEGAVRCWGLGDFGQLGNGSETRIGDNEPASSSALVDVGAAVTSVSAGRHRTCALLPGGAVRCWGDGTTGALGYGNRLTVGLSRSPAEAGDVELGAPIAQISAGEDHTCAVTRAGAVLCWGLGADGRLGHADTTTIGDDETPASAGPVDVF